MTHHFDTFWAVVRMALAHYLKFMFGAHNLLSVVWNVHAKFGPPLLGMQVVTGQADYRNEYTSHTWAIINWVILSITNCASVSSIFLGILVNCFWLHVLFSYDFIWHCVPCMQVNLVRIKYLKNKFPGMFEKKRKRINKNKHHECRMICFFLFI